MPFFTVLRERDVWIAWYFIKSCNPLRFCKFLVISVVHNEFYYKIKFNPILPVIFIIFLSTYLKMHLTMLMICILLKSRQLDVISFFTAKKLVPCSFLNTHIESLASHLKAISFCHRGDIRSPLPTPVLTARLYNTYKVRMHTNLVREEEGCAVVAEGTRRRSAGIIIKIVGLWRHWMSAFNASAVFQFYI